ncbi:MAG: hypothetical protein BRD55_07275 [Bacteroidetes bacterium SW_9_63_38]|nr:MAG: hypothetical protein BRD55_07275 [Bacteroidetes bacterium SW_9_63_38]
MLPPEPRTSGFSYRVERKSGSDGTFTAIGTTSGSRFTAEQQPIGRQFYRITATDGQGNTITSPATSVEMGIGPYPNPARNTVTVRLRTDASQSVRVAVYDELGRRVHRDR